MSDVCPCQLPPGTYSDDYQRLRDVRYFLNLYNQPCASGLKQHLHNAKLVGRAEGQTSLALIGLTQTATKIGTEILDVVPHVETQAPHHMGMLAPWGNSPHPPLAWILRAVRKLISSRAMAVEAVAPEALEVKP